MRITKDIRFLIIIYATIGIHFQCAFAQESQQKRELVNRLIEDNKDDSAIIILNQILEDSPKDSIEHQGNVLYQIGRILFYDGNKSESLRYFNLAQEKFKKSNSKYFENKILQDIARVKSQSGNYDSAIFLVNQALKHWKSSKDSARIIGCLLDLGLYYYEYNQTEKALEHYIEIINLPFNQGLIQKAKAYNQMGNIWATDLNNEQKALEYYIKSLNIKLRLEEDFSRSISASYNNIGLSYKNLGNLDSAIYYYQKALDLAKKTGDVVYAINPLNNLSNIYKRQNNLKKAEEALLEAEQYLPYGTNSLTITIQTSLGILYNSKQQYSKALKHLKIAEEYSILSGNLEHMSDVQEFLIKTYSGLNQADMVDSSLAVLLDLKDSILNLKLNRSVADMMVKYETDQKDKELLFNKQQLLEKDLKVKRLTLWFMLVLMILLISTTFIYLKFKKKQAHAKQAELELSLNEQKIKNKIQEERLRISRELHDNIGSHLTLINALTEDLKEDDGKVIKVRKSILLSMKELRKTVWLLNNESNSVDEIIIRLRDFLSNTRDNSIKIQILGNGKTESRLSDIQTTHLFRTIQEAVNNAIKYAFCSEIKILISVDENNLLEFEINDNGRGFDKNNTNSNNGLENMNYRIQQLKGNLEIDSYTDKGTTIKGYFSITR